MIASTPEPQSASHSEERDHLPVGTATEVAVARLSREQISSMPVSDIIRIIRAVRLPVLRDNAKETLHMYDRPTLERLMHLAQRCCLNRLGGEHQS